MKRNLLCLLLGAVFVLSHSLLWADCPEDPRDSGICDTLYVDIWPGHQYLVPGEPHYALFPIRVTHDLPDPNIDSIAAFVIPLCYTSSNPAAQAQVDPTYNSTDMWSFPACYISIFRPPLDCEHVEEDNWMWSLLGGGGEWDTRVLDRGDQHFWLALFRTGSQDQQFWEGSQVLLATATFRMEDTTTICFDTCFWPPASHLSFSRSDAVTYTPRTNLPACFTISLRPLGDCNADGVVDAADAVYLINYLFCGGTAPPLELGDVNCNGSIDGADIVLLINYLFRGGPEPSC
jgi:hypothetical protein